MRPDHQGPLAIILAWLLLGVLGLAMWRVHLNETTVGAPGQPSAPSTRRAGVSPSFSPARRAVLPMRVTSYCPCSRCCGRFSDGLTASGLPVSHNGGRFAAGPPEIPFGTFVIVPGYADGKPIPIIDRGGAIKGRRIDVFFPTHEEALRWGVRQSDVEILK